MAIAKRLDDIESIIRAKKNNSGSTVFGVFRPFIEGDVIHPDKAIHVKSVKLVNGEWIDTDEDYLATISEKALPALTSNKRFIGLVGGRGSGKSEGESQKCVAKMHDNGEKVACFREFQNSIDDSVYSSLEGYIGKWNMSGFKCNNGHIKHASGGEAKFRGIARNPDSIKSMNGFKTFWVEEAQASSENSLKLLTPTMREEGGQIVFTANPGSSEDPFSRRFITPFKDGLDRDGFYEDDLHLIIKINWRDNPWFPESLNQERMWDYEHLPRALYDHIWEGEFNDSVENALVMSEWFDACIDAHIKLGFKSHGVVKVTHDPSDLGSDPKAIALRKGNVFLAVEERDDLDVNEGCDWATGFAVEHNADQFEWDVGGMGTGLRRQVNDSLGNTKIDVYQFNGASSTDRPDAKYEASLSSNVQQQKTNKEVFRNLRAQCYASIRDRIYLTYRAVVHDEICDPEKLISFSSDIKHLSKLRSELCRMPIKPNGSGLLELYTKDQMRRMFKLASPNLSDVVMMSERKHVKMIVEEVDINALHAMSSRSW